MQARRSRPEGTTIATTITITTPKTSPGSEGECLLEPGAVRVSAFGALFLAIFLFERFPSRQSPGSSGKRPMPFPNWAQS